METTQQRNNATTQRPRRAIGQRVTLLLSCFLMSLSQAWAQPPFGYAELSNCYQQFNWGVAEPDTPKLNFINSPGGRFLSFNVGGNPHDIDGYQVVYFDQNGDSVLVSNIQSPGTLQIPPNYPSIQINPINSTGGFAGYFPAIVNFIDPVEAINISPNNTDCFTFSNFNFNSVIDLDGLCETPNYQVVYYEGGEHPLGPEDGVEPGSSYSLDERNFCNPPAMDPSEPCEFPRPCPRCTNLYLKITIKPCELFEYDPNCPDLVINYPITICCFCGNESIYGE